MKQFKVKYILVLCCLLSRLNAQTDTIVQKSGLRSPVKVVSMNRTEVRFNVPGEDPSKINSLKHFSIDYVITVDGKKVFLKDLPESEISSKAGEPAKITNYKEQFTQHFIGFELSKIIFTTFTLNYRFIHASGIWGVKVPIAYNLAPQIKLNYAGGAFFAQYMKFTTGLEFSLYPFKQKRISYFTGPEFSYGPFDYGTYYNYIGPAPPEANTIYRDGYHLSFVINNGVLFRISDKLWAETAGGLGIQKNEMHQLGENIIPRVNLNFSMGYSF